MRSSTRRIGLALLGGLAVGLFAAPAAASAATDPGPQAGATTAGVVKPLAGPYVNVINKKSNRCLDRKSEDGGIDGARVGFPETLIAHPARHAVAGNRAEYRRVGDAVATQAIRAVHAA